MSAGVLARAPNEPMRFVPVPAELLGCCAGTIAGKLREVLAQAFDWAVEEPEAIRVLFQEKELDGPEVATSFLEAMGHGKPCVVRILFKLLGGKGGFGALLRKQMGLGKKTTNFDAMRDLSGRRLRHSKAVDRIKEWMAHRKSEDDLVRALTGEGPELPKPVPASESLNPEFVDSLKRCAANKPSLVRQGMRKLDAEPATSAAADGHEQKRARTKAGLLNARSSLGEVSSPSSEPEGEGEAASGGSKASKSSSAAAAAAATQDEAAIVERMKSYIFVRFTENPAEPGYTNPAQCDLCDQDNLPATCPFFYHCAEHEFDICPKCAEVWGVAASTSASSVGGGAAAAAAAAAPDEAVAAASEAAVAVAPSSNAVSSGPAAVTAVDAPLDDGEILGLALLKHCASAEDLARKVHMDKLKRSLQHFGLKCGGKPDERAARLFLLKTTKREDLPKAVLAQIPKSK